MQPTPKLNTMTNKCTVVDFIYLLFFFFFVSFGPKIVDNSLLLYLGIPHLNAVDYVKSWRKKTIEKIENLCQGKFYSYPFFVEHLVMSCVRVLAAGQYNEVMCYIDCSGCCERHLQAFVLFVPSFQKWQLMLAMGGLGKCHGIGLWKCFMNCNQVFHVYCGQLFKRVCIKYICVCGYLCGLLA